MNTIVGSAALPGSAAAPSRPRLDHKTGKGTWALFVALLVIGLGYTAYSIATDYAGSGETLATAVWPFVLLGLALLIALGFEFVNGFHDTANAVATVIYTNSLPPQVAVVWSGLFNFLGVLVSSGAVAFGIIALLPVELILQVGSSAGFAMVFALLIAAIVWNLGTWALGLPASSSHTLIGSIIGVGVANALMHGRDGTSGVDWSQALKIGYSLLLSPLVGFVCAALLLLVMRAFIKNKALYEAPKGSAPPPWWIRGMLILTCTGVWFSHGSNHGPKGMGQIKLIHVGTVPISYALNMSRDAGRPDHAVRHHRPCGAGVARAYRARRRSRAGDAIRPRRPPHCRRAHQASSITDQTLRLALAFANRRPRSATRCSSTSSRWPTSGVPAAVVANVRNDMYLGLGDDPPGRQGSPTSRLKDRPRRTRT